MGYLSVIFPAFQFACWQLAEIISWGPGLLMAPAVVTSPLSLSWKCFCEYREALLNATLQELG